jgi:hypothetical protein
MCIARRANKDIFLLLVLVLPAQPARRDTTALAKVSRSVLDAQKEKFHFCQVGKLLLMQRVLLLAPWGIIPMKLV